MYLQSLNIDSELMCQQATPFVAGLTAYFVGILGNLPPAELRRQLTVYAVKDVLANVRE